jgi:general stress protein 26
MPKIITTHTRRVRDELIKAGMTRYGLMKGESRHLPGLIHEDEHIGGVVYGRAEKGSAMLVATDKRVLYLDHKVMFNRSDELSYDIVSGVSNNIQPGYAGVVLHTRLGDFELKFVNLKCARRFVRFVEQKRIEQPIQNNAQQPSSFVIEGGQSAISFTQKAKIFLMTHETAVLSTIDIKGYPHGSAVYYAVDKNHNIHIVTKTKTTKAKNIRKNSKVSLTIYDTASLQTLHISGHAHVEQNPETCKQIYHTILRPRFEGSHTEMPPILNLPAGEFEVITLQILNYTFIDYRS